MSADYVLVRTEKVAVKGTAFSYRRFGAESSVPLILLTHFRASMDNRDPLLLNLIAKQRTVVAFDNKGVASSEGATP
jgi:pimeloyl-ACP methyl ester carboxylesterase